MVYRCCVCGITVLCSAELSQLATGRLAAWLMLHNMVLLGMLGVIY
jgi:hypothetical protein